MNKRICSLRVNRLVSVTQFHTLVDDETYETCYEIAWHMSAVSYNKEKKFEIYLTGMPYPVEHFAS